MQRSMENKKKIHSSVISALNKTECSRRSTSTKRYASPFLIELFDRELDLLLLCSTIVAGSL